MNDNNEKKVRPGERMQIPAATWNNMIDGMKAFKRSKFNKANAVNNHIIADLIESNTPILVYNASDYDQTTSYRIMRLNGTVLDVAEAKLEANRRIAFNAYVPTDSTNPIAILQSPLEMGDIGRAITSGITVTRVKMADMSHEWANPVAGSTDYLVSNVDGQARILWFGLSDDEGEQAEGIYLAIVHLIGTMPGVGTNVNVGLVTNICPIFEDVTYEQAITELNDLLSRIDGYAVGKVLGLVDPSDLGWIDPPEGTPGPEGPEGPEGPTGPTGPAGPNVVDGSTTTTLTGYLKGNGAVVSSQVVPIPIADGGTGGTTQATARTGLGLGTAATEATGTTGHAIGFLDGGNTWSAFQIFSDFRLKDSSGGGSKQLVISIPEVFTANHTFTIIVNDADRTFTLAGNATLSGTHSGTSSGTNTGDQTTVSGNAGTATALQTARNINGVAFDGTANITVPAAGSTLTDTVTVAKGGTGVTTLTSNGVLIGNGTGAITATAEGATGKVLTGVTGGDPVYADPITGNAATVTLASDFIFTTAVGTFSTPTGMSVTLAAGTYLIGFSTNSQQTPATGTGHAIQFKLVNTSDATDVTSALLSQYSASGTVTNIGNISNFVILTLAATKTIALQVARSGGTTWTDSRVRAGSTLTYAQLKA